MARSSSKRRAPASRLRLMLVDDHPVWRAAIREIVERKRVGEIVADIGPGFSCDATGQPSDVRYLSTGRADLRFHAGGYQGMDFPVDTPTNVRIDLFNLAATLQPGHRLAMEISFGETHIEYMGQPYFPEITVHADGGAFASHLVLPIVDGSCEGTAPTLSYPSKPFVPRGDGI